MSAAEPPLVDEEQVRRVSGGKRGGLRLRWPEGTCWVAARGEYLLDKGDDLVCFTPLKRGVSVRFLTESKTEIWETFVQSRLDRLAAAEPGGDGRGGDFWEQRARLAESLLSIISIGMGTGDNEAVDQALRRWRAGL